MESAQGTTETCPRLYFLSFSCPRHRSRAGDWLTGLHSKITDRVRDWSYTALCPSWEVCTGYVRTEEVCTGYVRTGELCTGYVKTGEVCTRYVRTGEVCTGYIRTGEVCTGYVRTGEVCAADVRTGEIMT